jgi:hypothetical protein
MAVYNVGTIPPPRAKYALYYRGYVVYAATIRSAGFRRLRLPRFYREDASITDLKTGRTVGFPDEEEE